PASADLPINSWSTTRDGVADLDHPAAARTPSASPRAAADPPVAIPDPTDAVPRRSRPRRSRPAESPFDDRSNDAPEHPAHLPAHPLLALDPTPAPPGRPAAGA